MRSGAHLRDPRHNTRGMEQQLPIALIDMDGPLADFDPQVYALCEDLGFPLHDGEVSIENPCSRHRFLTACMAPEHADAVRHIINTSRWFRDLPPTPGAQEWLPRLAEVAEVWICTKPLEQNHTCRDDKAAWLREHLGQEWEDRLIIAPDKSLVHGDVLLDDAIKPEWFARASWEPVVFPCPFNGQGSKWENVRRWTWGDPIEDLLPSLRPKPAPVVVNISPPLDPRPAPSMLTNTPGPRRS